MSSKRGQMQQLTVLGGIVVTVVVVAIIAVIGLELMNDTGEDVGADGCAGYFNPVSDVCQVSQANTTTLSANNAAFNATTNTEASIAKVPSKLPLIITAVIGAVLIGIVVSFLAFGRK